MIIVRQEEKKDIDAIRSVHLAAFKTSDEADLVNALRTTSYYDRELSLVAEKDGQIVGHILFTRVVIKEGNQSYPALSLAPLAVIPSAQNQQIGSLLITKGLERCKYLGYKLVTVLGNPAYYKRFGFEQASLHDIIPPASFPEEAFMVSHLSPAEPTIKGTVLYPREFNIVL
ncbi:MAG: GNAT family N-acetyltransferase [Cellulosilyticaceae bacterium]